MIDRDVIKLLLKRGFYFAACNQPDVAIFYKPKSPDTLDVCILSDFTGGYVYLPQQLYAIAIERKFIFNGYHNISCHFILFTDNLDRDRNFTLSGLNFWLVDTVMKRLIIYDNQPSDFYLLREELENKIATFTGGRAAEELIFHSITTGAANDIEQATKLARAMITRYGMTDEFDMVAMETVNNQYLGGDASLACSADTQKKIDEKVVEVVKAQHKKALDILNENKDKLHELANFLYEKETITGEEFMRILES